MIFSQKYDILKRIIIISQKWQDKADKVVEEQLGLTVRQWMLLSLLEDEFTNHLPTLSEAAFRYGTSRQNTKRLAIELQKKGFLIIAIDPKDQRILRIALTGKHREFFKENKNRDLFDNLSRDYFENMDEDELKNLNTSIQKLSQKLN